MPQLQARPLPERGRPDQTPRRLWAVVALVAVSAAGCGRSAPAPAGQTDHATAPAPAATEDQGASAPPGSAPGAPAAAPVKFVDLDGLRAELAARRKSGRPVLLNFWATWCAPCVDELPALGNLARELGQKDPEIIGVSLDMLTVPEKDRIEPKVRDMLSQSKVSYPNLVLMGDQQSFIKEYDISGGIPLSILYDGGGKIARRWIGSVETGDLRAAFQKLPPG